MFSVGDKVVCGDDVFDVETACYFSPLAKRGLVYVVRGVDKDLVNGRPVVWVCGMVGGQYIGRERPLRAARFRKLENDKVGESVELERNVYAA